MAVIRIRKLDNEVKARIGVPSATKGRSTEAEERRVLAQVARWGLRPEDGLERAIHELF